MPRRWRPGPDGDRGPQPVPVQQQHPPGGRSGRAGVDAQRWTRGLLRRRAAVSAGGDQGTPRQEPGVRVGHRRYRCAPAQHGSSERSAAAAVSERVRHLHHHDIRREDVHPPRHPGRVELIEVPDALEAALQVALCVDGDVLGADLAASPPRVAPRGVIDYPQPQLVEPRGVTPDLLGSRRNIRAAVECVQQELVVGHPGRQPELLRVDGSKSAHSATLRSVDAASSTGHRRILGYRR